VNNTDGKITADGSAVGVPTTDGKMPPDPAKIGVGAAVAVNLVRGEPHDATAGGCEPRRSAVCGDRGGEARRG
jgi:hypothetical protein